MSQFLEPNQGRYDENPTPAYVFDLDQLERRLSAIKGGITREKTHICFTVKANPFLVEVLKGKVDYFEVCSPGEFHICEYNKADMDRLIVTGVYKAPVDTMRMIGEFDGRTIFTVESLNQLQVLDFCAGKYECRTRVLLSLTSGNQLGMKASQLEYCISHRDEYKNLDFIGIQYYSGTQKKGFSKIEEELHMLENFCQDMKDKFGFETKVLTYGPGLGVPYFEDEEEEQLDQVLDTLNQLLNQLKFSGQVILEMGRFLTAFCGSYYTSVADVKSQGGENYCIIDGGTHHLNYYGQEDKKRIPHYSHMPQNLNASADETLWNVCGCLCTPDDVLAVQMPMRGPSPGDLLIFERTGAYCVTDGRTLAMSQDLPRIYFFSQDFGMELVRTREGTCKWNMRPEEDDEE
ncbi:MAG: diaminopimelate decarboxylase [Lachnospiraceae bacterium]|nr:diaminopimelate decarboxylase [Lachnospiraceae bacterium]